MAARSGWTPGFRRVPQGLKKKIGKHMVALAYIERLTLRIISGDPSAGTPGIADDTPEEPGEEITLSIDNGYKKFALVLTKYNEEELDALYEVIRLAFDHARPIVQERDELAEKEAQRGYDIFYRRHRSAPGISVFKRPPGSDGEVVPDGCEDVLPGDGAGGASAGTPGGEGGGMAEQVQKDRRTQDDASSADQHEEPRSGVRDHHPDELQHANSTEGEATPPSEWTD